MRMFRIPFALVGLVLCYAMVLSADSKLSRREIFLTDGIKHDTQDQTARISTAKARFQDSTPCPATRITAGSCPGFVVGHIRPLTCGGTDSPENMRWQAETAALKTERFGCK